MTDDDDPRAAARRTLRQLAVVGLLILVIGGYLVWFERDRERRTDDALRDLQCAIARDANDGAGMLEHCT